MKRKAFTLIELISVLVILLILALIVTPLVMNIIRKARIAANKRSIDAYGRSVELSIATHLLDTGTFPSNLASLQVEYTGKTVSCNVMQMKENGGLYMSECTVGNKEVHDDTDDGWYHYGVRDLTNDEYVEMYGKALEQALSSYYDEHNSYPSVIDDLKVDYNGKKVLCSSIINFDGTVYLKNCTVGGMSTDYIYGKDKRDASVVLLSKANLSNINNYSDGNTNEMYKFSHPVSGQSSTLIDYRYIGSSPNNYVYFNGNELWRIIGIFDVNDGNSNVEQRIKIVKNTKLDDDMVWNSVRSNDWSNADLKNFLNEDYYSELDENSKIMIDNAYFYRKNVYSDANRSADSFYSLEKYNDGTSWVGKIALMYPSDYLYTFALGVDDVCFNSGSNCTNSSNKDKSWLYMSDSEWLISPVRGYPYMAYHTASGALRGNFGDVEKLKSVRPSLYLSSHVKIVRGDGSEERPYQLSMN